MSLATHLVFDGQCAAAFHFYVHELGATLGPMLTYGGTPAESDVPPEWIVHGTVTIGGMRVCGADVPAAQYQKPQGFYLLLSTGTRAEAKRTFAILAEGGEVKLPLQQTFWSPAFGVVIDRFGVPWEVSAEG